LINVVQDIHTGRGAPAAIEIPIDLQYAPIAPVIFPEINMIEFKPGYEAMNAARDQIRKSKRRIILAGGGVIAADASLSLQQLAEKLNAPVLTTVDGRGSIPEDHSLCVGNYYQSAGMYKALQTADLTIAVGTRFAVGVEGKGAEFRPPGELLQIDIDPTMIGRTHAVSVGLHADVKLALDAINEESADYLPNENHFNQIIWDARAGLNLAMRKRLGPDFESMMDIMRAKLPRNGLLIRDSTIAAYNFANQLFPVYEPRTSISSTTSAIGPGLPFQIGASVGSGKPSLVIHGDGGFMFHATELATAAQYKIPMVICVFNDSGYSVLRWLQDTRFGRINETDLGKMNFVTMAESMGVKAVRVVSVIEFEAALDKGFSVDEPFLIDIDMEHFSPMEISMMPKKPDR
jgi:acetolactate synthase-1/2/3 large subunit